LSEADADEGVVILLGKHEAFLLQEEGENFVVVDLNQQRDNQIAESVLVWVLTKPDWVFLASRQRSSQSEPADDFLDSLQAAMVDGEQ
jgi:hypothetical protein